MTSIPMWHRKTNLQSTGPAYRMTVIFSLSKWKETIMKFLNEAWFWAGFFTALGSLGAVLIKELLSSRTQINVERLKLHERECLDAYKKLYAFWQHMLVTCYSPR